MKTNIFLILTFFSTLSTAQQVSNIDFTQEGKTIKITYDLLGESSQTYEVKVWYTTDEGQNWHGPLQYISGDVGINQKPGYHKTMLWDVLKEVDKLTAYVNFRIKAILSSYLGDSGIFIDKRDGQEYKWVRIGTQIWMAENLNVGRIIEIKKHSYIHQKNNNVIEKYCYKNKIKNCNKYGGLYQWNEAMNYSLKNTNQGICPKGWHLPSKKEWLNLIYYVEEKTILYEGEHKWKGLKVGKKLKSINNWLYKGNGSDEYDFNIKPSGDYYFNSHFPPNEYGFYVGLNFITTFWSSTEIGLESAAVFEFHARSNGYREDEYHGKKLHAYSIRCIKDQ